MSHVGQSATWSRWKEGANVRRARMSSPSKPQAILLHPARGDERKFGPTGQAQLAIRVLRSKIDHGQDQSTLAVAP